MLKPKKRAKASSNIFRLLLVALPPLTNQAIRICLLFSVRLDTAVLLKIKEALLASVIIVLSCSCRVMLLTVTLVEDSMVRWEEHE